MPDFSTHKNFALGTIATPPSPATSGELFPLMPGDGQFFAPNMPVTLAPPNVLPTFDNAEIGYITHVDGDTLTITRAQEGSLAKPVAATWQVIGTVTAKLLTDIENVVQAAQDKNHLAVLSGQTDVTITHGLGKYPSVTVFDSAGDEVEGDYQHIDANNTRLMFSAGFSGKAIFN